MEEEREVDREVGGRREREVERRWRRGWRLEGAE